MDDLVSKYRYGRCYPFSIAAAERFGWQIGALVVTQPPHGHLHVVHSYLVDHDGMLVDAGGEITEAGLVEEYLSDPKRYRTYSFERYDGAAAFKSFLASIYPYGDWNEFVKGLLEPWAVEALADLDRLPHYADRLAADLSPVL